MQFDPVETGGHRPPCGVTVVLDDRLDLGKFERAMRRWRDPAAGRRCEMGRIPPIARIDGRRSRSHATCHLHLRRPSSMPKLREHVTAPGMDSSRYLLPSFDLRIRI